MTANLVFPSTVLRRVFVQIGADYLFKYVDLLCQRNVPRLEEQTFVQFSSPTN